MRIIFAVQLIIAFLGSVVGYFFMGSAIGWSFFAGSSLILFNFLLLSVGWKLIFRKKLIALAGTIIVIKYAFLGAALFLLSKQPWLDVTGFILGVASFMAPALVYAFGYSKRMYGV